MPPPTLETLKRQAPSQSVRARRIRRRGSTPQPPDDDKRVEGAEVGELKAPVDRPANDPRAGDHPVSHDVIAELRRMVGDPRASRLPMQTIPLRFLIPERKVTRGRLGEDEATRSSSPARPGSCEGIRPSLRGEVLGKKHKCPIDLRKGTLVRVSKGTPIGLLSLNVSDPGR